MSVTEPKQQLDLTGPQKRRMRRAAKKPIRPSDLRPRTLEHILAQGRARKPRTGQPAHFKEWMRVVNVTKYLKEFKLFKLAAMLSKKGEAGLAKRFMLLSVHYKSVWDLSQASRSQLLAHKGFGQAGLDAVYEYLTAKNVDLMWSPR